MKAALEVIGGVLVLLSAFGTMWFAWMLDAAMAVQP